MVQALIFGVLVGFLELCFGDFGTSRSGFGVLFLVILVLITVGFGTLGGSGVVTVLLPGPVSPLLLIFWTNFWSCLVILIGLLLLCWLVTYLFGIVLPGLLGNSPLGDFLIVVVFVIWLLIVLMVPGFLVVFGWVGICFLLLLVVLVILLMIGFWRALKEFDSTEKHQHTLHVQGFGRDCGFPGSIGVQFVILMCCMSVIMMALGLLWVTG